MNVFDERRRRARVEKERGHAGWLEEYDSLKGSLLVRLNGYCLIAAIAIRSLSNRNMIRCFFVICGSVQFV